MHMRQHIANRTQESPLSSLAFVFSGIAFFTEEILDNDCKKRHSYKRKTNKKSEKGVYTVYSLSYRLAPNRSVSVRSVY